VGPQYGTCITITLLTPRILRLHVDFWEFCPTLRGRKDTFLFSQQSLPALGPPSLLFSGYWGSFPGVKQLGNEVDHWPPSRAEIKNEHSYTSAPPICLLGVDRVKFNFFVLALSSIILPVIRTPESIIWGMHNRSIRGSNTQTHNLTLPQESKNEMKRSFPYWLHSRCYLLSI
jgi:hypothetical protein